MIALAAAGLALALLATAGIARALPLTMPLLASAALVALALVLAESDPVTAETCSLAGIAAAAAMIPQTMWRAADPRMRLAIAALTLPLAAYALATASAAALPLGLAALVGGSLAGRRGAAEGWIAAAALGIAALAGGGEAPAQGMAAACLVGIAGAVPGRHGGTARIAALVLAIPCLLPVAAGLAARAPWLLAPLVTGLLSLAALIRRRPAPV